MNEEPPPTTPVNQTPAQAVNQPGGVTITQAAALLGVHVNTVRRRVKSGELPAQKVLTAQGIVYVIDRAALGLPGQEAVNQQLTVPEEQGAALVVVHRGLLDELAAQRAERAALVERIAASERALATAQEQLRLEQEQLRAERRRVRWPWQRAKE